MDVSGVGKSERIYYSFPEHQHGYWEIMLNLQGTGSMDIGGRTLRFKPGDIFVIPPYTPHKKESDGGFTDICMFIKNFRTIGKAPLKVFADDERGSVRQIMEMAYEFWQTESVYDRSAVNVMGDLVYQILVSYFNRNQKMDLRLEGIIELMHDNVTNADFDLAATIEESGYSKSYFRKIFKKVVGESPLAHFNHLRINHAKSMLQQYGDSRAVGDIAMASGFKDPLYFSRVFKQYENVSPKEYARNMKELDVQPIIMDTPKEYLPSYSENREEK